MSGRKTAAIAAILLIAVLARSYPEDREIRIYFKGARVVPHAGVLAYGSATINGREVPFATLIDGVGISWSLYIELPYSGTLLDYVIYGERLIGVGYVDTPDGRRALATAIDTRHGSNLWAFYLGEGYALAKALTPAGNHFVISGIIQLPDAKDSDLLIALTDESGNLVNSVSVGTAAYSDFVERCYSLNDDVLLVGSTWGYNVSYSDALLAWKTGDGFSLVTVGGADRDEALAALQVDGKLFAVGVTHTSQGGLSDAFLASVVNGSLKVLTIGWPSYDGFTDLAQINGSIYILGYTIQKGRMYGLIVKVSEDGSVKNSVAIGGEADLAPFSIGRLGNDIVATFGCGSGLLILELDKNLAPSKARILGNAALKTVKVLQIDPSQHIYNMSDSWSARTYTAFVQRNLNLEAKALPVALHSLPLSLTEITVEIGSFEQKEPPLQILLRMIESNIPLLILAIPLLAIIVAVIVTKHRT